MIEFIAGIIVALIIVWLILRRRTDREPQREIGARKTTTERREWSQTRPITDELRFWIEYADADGVVTEREIRPVAITIRANRPEVTIRARCMLRQDDRSFRSERILSARNMATRRPISDLGQYLRAKY